MCTSFVLAVERSSKHDDAEMASASSENAMNLRARRRRAGQVLEPARI
jgi:hypothetical protein